MTVPDLRFMRDPTRGGLATVAHEIARATGLCVRLREAGIPVNDPVQSVCELLGFDPLYLACEGRIVAVVGAAERRGGAGGAAQGRPGSRADRRDWKKGPPQVVLATAFGGQRSLDELEDDPLPRIC